MSPRHDPSVAEGHSTRFRQVSSKYPHIVARAYGGDLVAAVAATDDQVAAKVAEWELAQGLDPRDWAAIGVQERAGGSAGGGRLLP